MVGLLKYSKTILNNMVILDILVLLKKLKKIYLGKPKIWISPSRRKTTFFNHPKILLSDS